MARCPSNDAVLKQAGFALAERDFETKQDALLGVAVRRTAARRCE